MKNEGSVEGNNVSNVVREKWKKNGDAKFPILFQMQEGKWDFKI